MKSNIVRLVCSTEDCFVGNMYDGITVDTVASHHEAMHLGHRVFAHYKEI